ncbi:MAG TPA: thermostable hemolysin [Pseudomonas sp.]|jgi:hypothetical protein
MSGFDWNIQLPLQFGTAGTPGLSLTRSLPGDGARQAFEAFIQARFQQTHGALINHFMPELFGLNDGNSSLCAVAGVRRAAAGDLFLEHYLDEPVEQMILAHAGRPVDREGIVEVGNLAASNVGSARLSIITVTWLLAMGGFEWVAFTGNSSLVNSFNRLGLRPVTLCVADPLRLGEERHAWGTYYQTQPSVHVGDIRAGFIHLSKMGLFERFGLPLTLEQTCDVA